MRHFEVRRNLRHALLLPDSDRAAVVYHGAVGVARFTAAQQRSGVLAVSGEPNYRLGKTAMIRVGGIEIVTNTARQQVFSTHCFEHGIDPLKRHVLVVKSTQHFMNGFGPIASRIV